jgi:DNA polymerase
MLDGTGIDSKARRVLEIRQELGKTSTKKYDAVKTCICADKRVRGMMQFYGANRSGRWAGRLVQLQNLPRTYLDPLPLARELVKRRSYDGLRLIYGSVNDTLSQLIRTAFVASDGNILIDADFSAIEARVISWLAREEWRLEVFRTHGKIYEASASQMFGVPIEKIKKGNPEYALRAKGKVAELALGYQGGASALISMGALDMGLSEDELPDIVERWRQSNSNIQSMWWQFNEAVLNAIRYGQGSRLHGCTVAIEQVRRDGVGYHLTIQLPSGRKLYYADPRIGTNRFGGESIIYKGMTGSKTGVKKYGDVETYGGKIVENITQAVARDCLAEAIERLEAAGYPVVFHIHDEVVIDIKPYAEPNKMLQDVIDIMSEKPAWAPDLPLAADGWVGEYFKKD